MSRKGRGDTIVEVLLAIVIGAFGMGVTYATAQRGLNQTITAREHNQALNYIQNQITDLRLRFQNDPNNFETNFGYTGNNHFCLDNSATTPRSSGWLPITNPSPTDKSPLTGYDSKCTANKAGDGVTYYMDIKTTQLSGVTAHPTLYQVIVRWERSGGGATNQASTYFRINGGTASLGTPLAPGPNPGPNPICTPIIPSPTFGENDNLGLYLLNSNPVNTVVGVPYRADGTGGRRVEPFDLAKFGYNFTLKPSCTYTITVSTTNTGHPLNDSPNEQMFMEFCTDLTTCSEGVNYDSISSAPFFRSPLSQDIPALQTTLNPSLVFNLPPVSSDVSIKYIILKHCALWQPSFTGSPPAGSSGTPSSPGYVWWGTCRSRTNSMTSYSVTVSAF